MKGHLAKKTHNWYGKDGKVGLPKTVEKTTRNQPIDLNQEYYFEWKDYCEVHSDSKEIADEKNNIFKYMLVEVAEKE